MSSSVEDLGKLQSMHTIGLQLIENLAKLGNLAILRKLTINKNCMLQNKTNQLAWKHTY